MPQVAARINESQERWLKEYFRTKNAGAEFILPWAVDTFFRAIVGIKNCFSPAELKTIVEVHKDSKVQPEHTRTAYLVLRVLDACETTQVHTIHGASKANLEAKLKRLDDTQSTALMIWAAAFWVSKEHTESSLEEYIRVY